MRDVIYVIREHPFSTAYVVFCVVLVALVWFYVKPIYTTFPPKPKCDLQMRTEVREPRSDGLTVWYVTVDKEECYVKVPR